MSTLNIGKAKLNPTFKWKSKMNRNRRAHKAGSRGGGGGAGTPWWTMLYIKKPTDATSVRILKMKSFLIKTPRCVFQKKFS